MDYTIIDKYEKEIMADLEQLIAIPSVASEAEEGMPFGREAARALEFILDRAREMGFATVNVGNAAGHAEYGEGEEYAGVLTHVDVVPAGDGWETDPFTLTVKGNRLYGRGVADDKGAAVVSLWCLKALKDAGVTGSRRLRCVFGCGEEVGMDDMAAYFAQEPLPEMAFTPDSGYTVCNREKGILQFQVNAPAADGRLLISLEGGTAVNCVAEKAKAFIACDEGEAARITARIKESGCQSGYSASAGGFDINAAGRSAHAMQPHVGLNAAANLIKAIDFVTDGRDRTLSVISRLFCGDTNGKALGVAQSDEPSGALTMNLGNIRMDSTRTAVGIDIRFPVTADGKAILETITAVCAENGLTVSDVHLVDPIYMSEDEPLVKALCECYEQVSGHPAHIYATGGGTYARSLCGRGIAFGMEFPDSQPTRLHESNESFDKDELMQHARICLAAMHRMMTM